jgi:hypothetical protein
MTDCTYSTWLLLRLTETPVDIVVLLIQPTTISFFISFVFSNGADAEGAG